MLSVNTLRLLHRLLDDFVLMGKVKAGLVGMAELEGVLRKSGADAGEIREILADYRRHRAELDAGAKRQE